MRCPTPSSWILLAVGITATLASGPEARAQTASNTNVAAEALFEEARSLLAAGKYAEACPKFADSERLGPSVATLLNLANCWEKSGRTATAWATYREAASAAHRRELRGEARPPRNGRGHVPGGAQRPNRGGEKNLSAPRAARGRR